LRIAIRLLLYLFLFFTPYIYSTAQSTEIIVSALDSKNDSILKSILFQQKHSTKKSALNELENITKKLALKGYINNEFNLQKYDSIVVAKFTFNQKTDTIRIYYDSDILKIDLLKNISTNYNNAYFEISTNNTETVLNRLVNIFEEKGYSFASVKLNNLTLEGSLISASLKINLNSPRIIDDITIKGYNEFPKKKLKKIIGLKNKTPFNNLKLIEISKQLENISFADQTKKPAVLFTNDSTTIYIYIKKKSISKFDGLIGFSNKVDGKLELNGYLNLHLSNIFNLGEQFNLNWISNTTNKVLQISYNAPYIFNSNLNFKGNFKLLRKDTVYTNTFSEIAIGYNLNIKNSISTNIQFENSKITNTINESTLKDFSRTLIGINFNHNSNKITHIPNFNSFNISVNALAGKRNTPNINTNQFSTKININYLIQLSRKHFIFLNTLNELLDSSSYLQNELFRIGGFSTLRGVDEDSILASKYSVNNIEYHYIVNSSSYIYSITDLGLTQNTNHNNTFLAIGIGYSYKKNNSIFNIGYALGKDKNSTFNLNNSKIHLKLTYLL